MTTFQQQDHIVIKDRAGVVLDQGLGYVQIEYDDTGEIEIVPSQDARRSTFQDLKGLTSPTNADLKKARAYQASSDILSSPLITVTMVAADNMVDRGYARWTPDSLQKLSRQYKGYPLLMNHDVRVEQTRGLVFDAAVYTFTDVPSYFTNTAGNGTYNRRIVKDEGYQALVFKALAPNTDEFNSLVQSGVNKVSLGYTYEDMHCPICEVSLFSDKCPHGVAQSPAQQKDSLYAPYRNKVNPYDIYEISLVAEPNLPRAGILTEMHRQLG